MSNFSPSMLEYGSNLNFKLQTRKTLELWKLATLNAYVAYVVNRPITYLINRQKTPLV